MGDAFSAPVADIRRLTIHDGPGIRDTVFVKGCPLHCLWCHNPESISPRPQLLFRSRLCVNCGTCAELCPQKVHAFTESGHALNRRNCLSCGKCAEECLPGALNLCGTTLTAEEVVQSVLRDKAFFLNSGGGVTLSGGEPLLYPDFTAAVFRLLKEEGISTALDTCGAVPFAAFEKVLPWTDRILFDLKGMGPERHARNTGRTNEGILENLSRLGRLAIPVEIRMPVVPGHNDDPAEFARAGEFLKTVAAVVSIRLLPWHRAEGKYAICGIEDPMPETEPPSAENLEDLAAILRSRVDVEVSCD